MPSLPVETFPALNGIACCRHVFINRIPDLDVQVERSVALKRLETVHSAVRETLGFAIPVTAEQVHGKGIAIVNKNTTGPVAGVDGLITNHPDVCLGIYVADCCAVYLLDPVRQCIGLVHSGKAGTFLGIVPEAIEAMRINYGSNPADLLVQISPCIRPPFYEVDFAAEIVGQCRAGGVGRIHDCGVCTAADLQRYYSYRAEQGKTGRMLALFCLKSVIMPG